MKISIDKEKLIRKFFDNLVMRKKLLTSLLSILKNNLERLNVNIIYCKLNNVTNNVRCKNNELT